MLDFREWERKGISSFGVIMISLLELRNRCFSSRFSFRLRRKWLGLRNKILPFINISLNQPVLILNNRESSINL